MTKFLEMFVNISWASDLTLAPCCVKVTFFFFFFYPVSFAILGIIFHKFDKE